MQSTSETAPEGEIDSLTVLVAEDEVLLRMVMADHLRSSGFVVLECASGEEARKVMEAASRVDVVISDVHMKTPTEGLELAAWLSEHAPSVPVILASGSPTIAANQAWKALPNVTDFVPKPYAVERIEMLARARAAARDASSK
jgi:DNA-binding NtrC family response regulator